MSIVIDIDGPLFDDHISDLFKFANSKCSQSWSYATFVSGGDWQKATGLSYTKVGQIFQQFLAQSVTRPTSGAAAALQRLSHKPKFIATSRHRDLQTATVAKLGRYYGEFHGYYFGLGRDKHAIFDQIGATVLVDDNEDIVRHVASQTEVVVIMFPFRGRKYRESVGNIITLKSQRQAEEHVSQSEWEQVTRAAWNEIVDIVLNIL